MEDSSLRYEFDSNINMLLAERYMSNKRRLRWNLIHFAEYNKS